MTNRIPDDVIFSRRIIMGVALILVVLLVSLAWGALRTFQFPR